jgi:hypothetical protein
MDIEQKVLKLCEPKTIIISAAFDAVQNVFSGVCTLDHRIDRVVAMRVKYFNLPLQHIDVHELLSTMLVLRSTRLAANLAYDLYRTATSTDAGGQNAQTESNIIGWMVRNNTADFSNAATGIQQNNSNNIHRFTGPTAIESFDWSISAVNASFPVALEHPYACEIVIEFFQSCHCQSTMKNVYSM